jgi:hypothetical protein
VHRLWSAKVLQYRMAFGTAGDQTRQPQGNPAILAKFKAVNAGRLLHGDPCPVPALATASSEVVVILFSSKPRRCHRKCKSNDRWPTCMFPVVDPCISYIYSKSSLKKAVRSTGQLPFHTLSPHAATSCNSRAGVEGIPSIALTGMSFADTRYREL